VIGPTAEVLRPLAGQFAATLFTVGIVGVGFLAVPTLAGSAAYAFAETLGWRQGLDKNLKQARAFYTLILLSTGVGVGLDFVGINPVKALYWTAIINGLLAPFLLVAILIVASDKETDAGSTEFTFGMDRRGAHHGNDVRRRRSDVCCLDGPISLQSSPTLARFSQTIAETVQFGPADPIFPGLCCTYRGDDQSQRRALLWRLGKKPE
jgi:hypothetical protein